MTESSTRRTRKKRTWRSRFLLAFCSMMFALLLIEIGLRVIGFSRPMASQTDEHTGWKPMPNNRYRQTQEGDAIVETNSHGFRDDEWTVEKPADTLRIAVLADSYGDAVQVAEDARFSEVMEAALNESQALGKSVEVMNFGVSGYGTAQELQLLRNYVWDFDPDIVLLAFLSGNDIRNNHKDLEGNSSKPYFSLSNGKLVFDDSFRHSDDFKGSLVKRMGRGAAKFSRVAQLVIHVRRTWSKRKKLAKRNENKVGELGLSDLIYAPPPNERWEEAWAITEKIIETMNDEVKAKGKRFVVVTLSNASQVAPDEEERAAICKALEVEDLTYPDKRIAALGGKAGFPVLNMATKLLSLARESGTFFHGFDNTKLGSGHWNEKGHLAAGEEIAKWLPAVLATPDTK